MSAWVVDIHRKVRVDPRPVAAVIAPAASAAAADPEMAAIVASAPSLAALAAHVRCPFDAQRVLDCLAYNTDDLVRCPADALAAKRAHCFDGGMLAAALLQRLGHAPRLVFLDADDDDGHILALFSGDDGGVGAVAKSNFAALRYREPVYRTIRELVMSYFDGYFNLAGKRTLRRYSRPLCLVSGPLQGVDWENDQAGVAAVDAAIDKLPLQRLLSAAEAKRLCPVDRRSFLSGTLGTDVAGAYRGAAVAGEAAAAPAS